MPKTDYTKELAFAKKLALQAGTIMEHYFRAGSRTQVQLKHDKTHLTAADLEVNSLVIAAVQKHFPSHSIHGEEEDFFVADASHTWVCDPIDGTMPYAKGLPISTFSLALVDSQGQAVLGVVYDPFQKRLFEAVRGGGAFLNDQPMHVSDHAVLDTAVVDNEMWVNETEGVAFDDPRDMLNKAGAKVTTLCSAVITGCLVAQGEYEAMIFGQSKPEDIAALAVIVEEAGGKVTNLLGQPQRYDRPIYGAIVSNGLVHDDLVRVIAKTNYRSKHVHPDQQSEEHA